MLPTVSWIIVFAAVGVLFVIGLFQLLRQRAAKPAALPTSWALTARPVFNADERRVYRQLREALPHHIVLAKLPLVRFSQPTDPQEVRYWFELLGAIHVTFAICSANGRVLAAIDLDVERGGSRRVQQIKQAVLGACRVRYLRCAVDQMPSVAELQLLVPQSSAASRAPQSASGLAATRDALSASAASRHRQRSALWRDSGFFQDSFFGAERRGDGPGSEFGSLGAFLRDGSTPRGGMAPPAQDDRRSDGSRGEQAHR